jgi:hypothetical protein
MWYRFEVWVVRHLDEAAAERGHLPVQELNAMDHAVDKLEAFGPELPFPHQSDVRDTPGSSRVATASRTERLEGVVRKGRR